MMILKNIFSLVLPFLVLVIVPRSIVKDWTIADAPLLLSGVVLALAGLTIMGKTISLFISIGKGTLAPWSPTKKLVIVGPYRYVRNPMILGVFTVLLGEACVVASAGILIWAGAFLIINTIYFMVYEEPDLERKFGEEYRVYKTKVSRWIPRLTPFEGNQI